MKSISPRQAQVLDISVEQKLKINEAISLLRNATKIFQDSLPSVLDELDKMFIQENIRKNTDLLRSLSRDFNNVMNDKI